MNATGTRPQPERNNHHLLCEVTTGSLLTFKAVRVLLRERDIGERDIGEKDIGESDIEESYIKEMDIRETVTTCRFNQQLLIHIHTRGVSGCLSFSQS
jgi:hypothetical protein